MTKEQILQVTGLSEDEFYQQYPDQETFCNDYPEVCSQIEQNNYFDSVDYKAQNGIETSKPYTNFDDYKKAMQIYDVESAKARTYNNFQNDLYSYANQNPSLFETTTSLGNLFNTLSPQQQDALAQKYNAEFITDALSVNRKKYINSMEMNIPGKGMGYYSFPTNDVVYGTQELKRPNYEFPRLTVNTPDINRNKTFQPFKVLAPIVNNYNLPKELIKNNLQTVPLKDYKELQVLQHKMTPAQTMREVGSIGTSYTTPLNKYYSIVDLLKSQGKDSSFGERKKLAQMAGINNYTGSAAQNMQLIDYASKMKQGGIYINPANKGKFTESANRAGMGVQEFARHVLANKEDYSSTQVRRANFAKNASKWKHENGGNIPMYQPGGITIKPPTASDSLAVMNSALASRKYYDNLQKKGWYEKPTITKALDNLTLAKLKDVEKKSLETYLEHFNDPTSYKNIYVNKVYPKVTEADIKKKAAQSILEIKTKKPNTYVYKDLYPSQIDEWAPPVLLDTRINPQLNIRYEREGSLPKGTDLPGGLITYIKGYDPIVVKPASMKTKADWDYVKKNYPELIKEPVIVKPKETVNTTKGKVTGTIKPTHPIDKMKRLSIFNQYLDNPNIQMQGQPIPIQPMQLPQQGKPERGLPVYGPGNTIIGYTDNNGQFYPAQQYTGAPNNEFNLQDKKLLDNPELLKKYLSARNPFYKFQKGGYYGMDQRFHPNSDSGTYVPGGGYYFQDGSTVTSSTPPTSGSPVNISQTDSSYYGLNPDNSFRINTEEKYTFDKDPKEYKNFGSDGIDDEYDLYETPNLGGLNIAENQEQQNFEPFDASQYSSVIDPNTGFTTYSKNNKVLTNIKKQDPQLWEQLKEEGKGARFRTGQTDIQKFGRTAGKIAGTMQAGIDLAGTVGNVLSERNRRRDMNAAAINMGSTAGTYTNPQGSSKGDYGVTGSTYGAFKPYNVGTFSYKGMYGKYGMEVPKYTVGGYTPNLATLSDYGLEEKPELEFRNFNNIITPFIPPTPLIISPADNTKVARQRFNTSEVNANDTKTIDNTRAVVRPTRNYSAGPSIPNPNEKDVATKLNNPGNIIYNPVFSKFGAVKSPIKQTDGPGYFAAFPTLEAGLNARETLMFGEVDGIFDSKYYEPNTDINYALKKWSGGVNKDGTINSKGYGVEIYPELRGKTLKQITLAQRRELLKRQVKSESAKMYKKLQQAGVFKNGGEQLGGQVVEMDEDEIKQFLAAGGQLEFID